ncbi:MAG: nprA [Bacteroidota bacterium]|jgi:serine phosphatase RsbU (regulator of sigma subunit)|nr:nprA [Bacteroidota bacterium]
MERLKYAVLLVVLFCSNAGAQNRIDHLLKNSYRTLSTKYDSSIIYSDSVIVLAKTENNKHALAEAYKNKGLAFYTKGVYASALANYQEALTIAEKEKFNDILLSVYNLYGTFYKKLNKLPDASVQFNNAYKLAYDLKDTSGMAGALNDIGLVFQLQGKADTAIVTINKALEMYRLTANKLGESYSLNFLAELYSNQKNFTLAIDYLSQASQIRMELGDTAGLAINFVNLGEVNLQMGDLKNALSFFTQSAEIAERIKYADLLKHCYKMISEIYMRQKNFEQALVFYQKHVDIKDSIFNEQNTRIITEMEAKYQNTSKQLQIDNLHKQSELNLLKLEEQAARTRTLYIAIALFVIIILVVVVAYRNKKKANEVITLQKAEVEHQRDLVGQRNREVTDSINYAKRIQQTLLASEKVLNENLPEHFILYKPKDIVSGDFYWAGSHSGRFYFCVADCTGHGVPGAFMSLLNISFLNEALKEKHIESPDKILNEVREQIITSLNPEGSEDISRDGMDAVLCIFDFKGMWLRFACANNPLWLIRNNELKVFEADKMPVGKHHDEQKSFSLQTIGLRRGDIVYLLTDGYADQFGGDKGKKFKYKQLQNLLLQNSHLPMHEQKQLLDQAIEKWKGPLEQVDDILIAGIKF